MRCRAQGARAGICTVAPLRSGYGPGGVFLSDHKTGGLPGGAVSHRERAIFSSGEVWEWRHYQN